MPRHPSIVLVNPKGWRFVGDHTLPAGLLSIAAPLRDRFRIQVIDERVVGARWKALLDEALAERPVCVGVTAMTGPQILDGIEISRRVKARGPVPVVWGGVHASLRPRQTVESPWADYVVQGEGEESFGDLADALAAGREGSGILGVWSKQGGEAASAGRRPLLPAEKIPLPAFDLVDLDRYVLDGPFGRSLSLFSSRGCPFACAFCYNVAFFERPCWRALPADRVIGQVQDLANRLHLRHVQFLDDNFFADRARALEVARGIAGIAPGLSWSVLGGHVRNLFEWGDRDFGELAASRLREVLVGAESGSQAVLDGIGKGYRIEELLEVNGRLARAGIQPTYSFMSGLPGETDADLSATVELMFRLRKENPNVVLGNVKPFVPYPGTPLFERLCTNGHRPPERLEDWAGYGWYNYERLAIPWVPRERRGRLASLYYLSVLMSPDYLFVRSRLFRAAARIAGPIARYRVRRLDLRLAGLPRLLRWIQAHVL